MNAPTYTAENTSRTITVQDIKIHYHEAGTGSEVLVLLHGTGPGASSWGNFRGNLPDLAADFRVLAIDMPHYGESDEPANEPHERGLVRDRRVDVLDALGIKTAHFLGNSVGGSVALEIALARPELIDRLILMGTAGSLPMFAPLPTEGAKNIVDFYESGDPTPEKMERFVRGMLFDQSLVTPEFVKVRYEAAIVPELLVHRELNIGWMHTLWRRVADVHHKTLLVYGRDDRVVPWDSSLILLRLMPNADLHVFSRSGHWTQLERAGEFLTVIRQH
uniref:Hydrolase n=1 Tax=Sphingomonas sp. CB3 TaxID=76582 RepID=O85289_9SPHN|nr:hydrolase [Sphingomonas sp. CB3]